VRRIDLRRIADLECEKSRTALRGQEACRQSAALLARLDEEHHNAPRNEGVTVFEATHRYQRALESGASR
jgi:hypothetical protein